MLVTDAAMAAATYDHPARTFNESAEYEAARQSRQGIAVMRMVLVEGV